MDVTNNWLEGELMAMKPDERLTMSEWAVKKRELGSLSAVRGTYPLHITPYFGPVMDRCCSAEVDMQVLVANAQSGKTVACVENTIGYFIDQEPSSVMVAFADQNTSEYIAKHRVAPMFKNSSALNYLYDKKTFLKNEITTKNGARVDFVWATSIAALATKDVRVIIGDEVDKPGWMMRSSEANALSLFRERTKSFPSGYFKHIFLSTPTIPGGNILSLMDECDTVFDWQVRCPKCGVSQPLRWSPDYVHGFDDGTYADVDGVIRKFGRVEWEGGSEASREQIFETIGYVCGTCRAKWSSAEKNVAVKKGFEVPRSKQAFDSRSYGNHLNRLYSTLDAGDLYNMAKDWVRIHNLPKDRRIGEYQGFVNSGLAEPFVVRKAIGNKTEGSLRKLKVDLKPQTVPEQAVALVAAIDAQKYEFWFMVRAFAADYSSWGIHYGRLHTYKDVQQLLFDTYYPQVGQSEPMRIFRAGLDIGGSESRFENTSMTEEAYNWLREFQIGHGCRVWGMKGSSNKNGLPGILKVGQPLDKTPAGKKLPDGFQLLELDTFKLKTMFHVRMASAINGETTQRPAYMHSGMEDQYVKQVTAEKLQIDRDGQEVWINEYGRPNHLFDCECMCIALADPECPGGGIHIVNPKTMAASAVQRRVLMRRGIDGDR